MGAVKIWNEMEVAEEFSEKNCSTEIKSSSLTVDTSLSLPDMTPRVINLCKDLFKKWSKLDDSRFSVQTVSGGITNLLLKVTVRADDGNEDSVTVRLYGPNTDYVIDRERELQAIKYLSAAGFGAKLLGVFGNGMVQSFIIARTLEPSASKLKFDDDDEKQEKYQKISFKEVHNEILELEELTGRVNSPVVFAHNDLLSGNIMVNDDEGKLYFIDFEYGSYNYRGYDIGNHFNEYGGYDCDYSLYPNKDEQYHFIRHYLQPDKPHEVSEKDIEALYLEANVFMLSSHIYWALWALIQAKMSPINFDYLGYFFLRYNEYKKQKGRWVSLARSCLSGK
ncbi:probable ethanolamine kinase isoform X2 [Tripterygium wilfordii]|uniref:probable ethanolamine kinase isoform X2 n=1 Tax=Tripterygium wilfordii TaxID=458696 RepID=UPI0018F81B3F|nr:probable ethanolamine kinase isoform X2 [Tripterygium wilfordii]